jgi:hypothetical protein
MDERSLTVLRRKLEALNYTERLDAVCGPLVERLVEDLVRTTDSYRGAKLQASKYAQEIATFNTKVRAGAGAGAAPCAAAALPGARRMAQRAASRASGGFRGASRTPPGRGRARPRLPSGPAARHCEAGLRPPRQ